MRTVLEVAIMRGTDESRAEHYCDAELEIDLPFAPTEGFKIEQSAWGSGRRVKACRLDISRDSHALTLFVFMGFEVLPNEEECEQVARAYGNHGWTVKNLSAES